MSKRILVLYCHHMARDDMRVGIRQHLSLLESCEQKHQLLYYNCYPGGPPPWLRHLEFDAVLFHNLFLCMRWWDEFVLWKQGLDWIADLPCPKLAMPQDEYDHAEVLDEWLYDLGTDVIFSNFKDPAVHRQLYPIMHSRAKFGFALTGYIDDGLMAAFQDRVRPIRERPIDVVYRASHLPYWFGSHGQMKWKVGAMVDRAARARGMRTNVSQRYEDVILGVDWLNFLATSRAITGCEGGSSVIDRRGEYKAAIEDMLRRQPDMRFCEVSAHLPPGWDDDRLPLIGPRHLEAAMTRTCQILVEGRYVGVLEEGRHFIPIKRDFSNLDEVLDQLEDHERVQKMVDLAYDELCRSGRFSRKVLARDIEQAIDDIGPPAGAGHRLKGALLWPLRRIVAEKACDVMDIPTSEADLAHIGRTFDPPPSDPREDEQMEIDEMLREAAEAPRDEESREALTAIARVADALVFLTDGRGRAVEAHLAAFASPALPVWWVTADGAGDEAMTEGRNVRVPNAWLEDRRDRLHRTLTGLGARRPVLVVDDLAYADVARERVSAFTIFVADEPFAAALDKGERRTRLAHLHARLDLVVCDSESTARALRPEVGSAVRVTGLLVDKPLDLTSQLTAGFGEPIVFCRTVLDSRVDFAFLDAVAAALPEVQLWLSGPVEGDPAGLSDLVRRPNVRYLGDRPEAWRWYAGRAQVGMLPLLEARASAQGDVLAMAACGLPLISTQAFDLVDQTVGNAAEAVEAWRALRGLRHDEEAARRRSEAVKRHDPTGVMRSLAADILAARAGDAPMNVLVLHQGDARGPSVDRCVALWPWLSRHHVHVAAVECMPLLAMFDAVVLDESLVLDARMRHELGGYGGCKMMLALQDAPAEISADVGLHAVVTGPVGALDWKGVDVLPSLHVEGTVAPEALRPLRERAVALAFRQGFGASSLDHAQEVRFLLERLEAALGARELSLDWSLDEPSDAERLALVGRSRAVLVVHTLISQLDARGNLRDTVRNWLTEEPRLTYDEAAERFVRLSREYARTFGLPRLMEAVRSGTVLVMLEGDLYDELLQPGRHYLSLARDLSNLDEVVAALADAPRMAAMAAQAYAELLVGSERLSNVVRLCDDYIGHAVRRSNGLRIVNGPVRALERI